MTHMLFLLQMMLETGHLVESDLEGKWKLGEGVPNNINSIYDVAIHFAN